MNFDEFLRDMRRFRGKWILRPMDEDHENYFRLRAVAKDKVFCPITAVYFHKTGEYLYPYQWEKAAHAMGLQRAKDIMGAADSEFGIPLLRRKMLSKVGLEET